MSSNIEAGKQQTIKDDLDAYVVCTFFGIFALLCVIAAAAL